jgi:cytochrome c oxidase subunit I+III
VAAGLAALLGIGSALAFLAGPWATGMEPTAHAYPATVWLLVGWTAVHVAAGVLMQLYCIARRAAGRMDGERDIDIRNVTLFWHFVAITAVVTTATIAGFPLVA